MKIGPKEINDSRSFEERVFARFDTVDEQFDRVEGRLSAVEIRITNLEARHYDTKPIWERALAEIAQLSAQVQTGLEGLRNDLRSEFQTGNESMRNDLRSEFQTGIEGLRNDLCSEFQAGNESLRNDLRSEFQTGMESLRTEMKAEFAAVRHEMEHGQRVVARTIDTLNRNFLEVQTYQRYVDRRLEYLEAKVDTT